MVAWGALDALSHEFELCKIDATTRVVVVVDDAVSTERASLIRAAIARFGASAVEIRTIDSWANPGDISLLLAATATADVIITTGTSSLPDLGSDSQQLLHLPNIDPQAFPPHASLRSRTRSLNDVISTGTTVIIADEHGSSLHVELAQNVIAADHGILDDDNRVACFPAGWVGITPAAGSIGGQLVLMPGDANLGAKRLINSPVRLNLLDDHVSEIKGESPDADVIRAMFEYADDPSAYGVANITIGLNPAAAPANVFDDRLLDPLVSRLLAGTVTISFGHNLVADRPCNQTITLALSRRSVTIDGLPVISSGQLQGDFAPDVYEL